MAREQFLVRDKAVTGDYPICVYVYVLGIPPPLHAAKKTKEHLDLKSERETARHTHTNMAIASQAVFPPLPFVEFRFAPWTPGRERNS